MECQELGTEALEELRQKEPTNKIGYMNDSACQADDEIDNKKTEVANDDVVKSAVKADTKNMVKSAVVADREISNKMKERTTELNLEDSPIKVNEKN